ncbi:MAG: hypothetical protein ACLS8R_05610 [Anaeromassilibacillus sp.]
MFPWQRIKKEIIAELDRRVNLLREHQYDQIQITGNEYSELNQALSRSSAPAGRAGHQTLYKAFKKTRGNQYGFWFPSLFWESSGCALRTQPVIFTKSFIYMKRFPPKSLE